jgi:sensor domain CHASE-containing protein
MVWVLLPLLLALGLLLVTLVNVWRTRAIERRWKQALHEQERWGPLSS